MHQRARRQDDVLLFEGRARDHVRWTAWRAAISRDGGHGNSRPTGNASALRRNQALFAAHLPMVHVAAPRMFAAASSRLRNVARRPAPAAPLVARLDPGRGRSRGGSGTSAGCPRVAFAVWHATREGVRAERRNEGRRHTWPPLRGRVHASPHIARSSPHGLFSTRDFRLKIIVGRVSAA